MRITSIERAALKLNLLNMFKIKESKFIGAVIKDLIRTFQKNKDDLFTLNHACTRDTTYWIEEDWNYVIDYLKNFEKNHKKIIRQKRKPKGSVLIVLSYNEPLILSVIPVLSALIGGNIVKVRPSKRAQTIIRKVWLDSGIISKYNLDLELLLDMATEKISHQIKLVNAVYFFGGYKVAKKLAKLCAENFVEFFPEIEAADCKVINLEKIGKYNLEEEIALTLQESFSHCGQICHRIQGIILVGNLCQTYVDSLKKHFLAFSKKVVQYLADDYEADEEHFKKAMEEIKMAHPKEILKSEGHDGLPMLVISPKIDSTFVKEAYFLPILWVINLNSKNDLLSFLNSRRYYLGINIWSADKKFISSIVDGTKFSRYTINVPHAKIRSYEGWGGVWPSGYAGYKSWLEHFTNPYAIIKK